MANITDSIKESGEKIKSVFAGEAKKVSGQSQGIFENLFNTLKKEIPSASSFQPQIAKPVATKEGDIVISPPVIVKTTEKKPKSFMKNKIFGIPIIGVGAIGLIYFLIKRKGR